MSMDIDDLLDRAKDQKRIRDEAAAKFAALVTALDGLAAVDLLDATQKRQLGAMRPKRRKRRRPASASGGPS